MNERNLLFRVAFAVVALMALTPPAFTQATIVIAYRNPNGAPAGSWNRGSGINAEYVSWLQSAGAEFHDATITAVLQSTVSGVTAQGTAYLYRAAANGPLSSASLVAGIVNPAAVSVSSTAPIAVTLFSGVPLPAPSAQTYYLVVVPAAGAAGDALGWAFGDALHTTGQMYGLGVPFSPGYIFTDIKFDQLTTGAVASPPNGTSAFVAASPNTMLFQVTGLVDTPAATPSSVPTLGTLALTLTIFLLAAVACLMSLRPAIE